jgi:hypothetical protein
MERPITTSTTKNSARPKASQLKNSLHLTDDDDDDDSVVPRQLSLSFHFASLILGYSHVVWIR